MRTALLDMDRQFGTLPLYLDLTPREGVIAALANADQIDTVALEGYMLKHPSGLRLLASMSEELASPWEIPQDRFGSWARPSGTSSMSSRISRARSIL
jgi:pilus assembly protein CpaE